MGLEAEEAEMTEETIELAHSLLKRLLLEQDAAAKTCINADTQATGSDELG